MRHGGGFPRFVENTAHRCELSELMLALSIICAASLYGWPPQPHAAQWRPGHRAWRQEIGLQVAVDLGVLWEMLPQAVQGLIHRHFGGGGGGAAAGDAATPSSLARFISLCCRAVRLVRAPPGGAPTAAALAAGWDQHLLSHELFAQEVAALQAYAVDAAAASRDPELPILTVMGMCSPSLKLYAQVIMERQPPVDPLPHRSSLQPPPGPGRVARGWCWQVLGMLALGAPRACAPALECAFKWGSPHATHTWTICRSCTGSRAPLQRPTWTSSSWWWHAQQPDPALSLL
jgi:hypothetical protein